MKSFQYLKRAHSAFHNLMQQIEECARGEAGVRIHLFTRLKRELICHIHLEEQVLMAALDCEVDCEDSVLKCREHHALLENLLLELEGLSAEDVRWMPKFRVFRDLVELHFDCEENELFMDALESLSECRLEEVENGFASG